MKILFTSTGTVELWSRSYDEATGVPTTTQLDETVTLPDLPEIGRLTIETHWSPGIVSGGGGPSLVTPTAFDFAIDHIRAE